MYVTHALTYLSNFQKPLQEWICVKRQKSVGCGVTWQDHDHPNASTCQFGSQVTIMISIRADGGRPRYEIPATSRDNTPSYLFKVDGGECQWLCLLPFQHEPQHCPGRFLIFLNFSARHLHYSRLVLQTFSSSDSQGVPLHTAWTFWIDKVISAPQWETSVKV